MGPRSGGASSAAPKASQSGGQGTVHVESQSSRAGGWGPIGECWPGACESEAEARGLTAAALGWAASHSATILWTIHKYRSFFISLQNSSRQGDEGPWVWLAYRAARCLFSSHIFAPCSLTFVRRVHSQIFEGGIGRGAPRFLASERVIGSLIDLVMPARDAGA